MVPLCHSGFRSLASETISITYLPPTYIYSLYTVHVVLSQPFFENGTSVPFSVELWYVSIVNIISTYVERRVPFSKKAVGLKILGRVKHEIKCGLLISLLHTRATVFLKKRR